MSIETKRKRIKSNNSREVKNPELLRGEFIHNNYGKTRNYKSADECYTPREGVESAMSILDKEQFRGKTLYCPCDCEQSEFTKYFIEHKDELGLKEFIHTSDDFNTHRDIFERADIVITNPPFSKMQNELIPLLIETKCDYLLFCSNMNIFNVFLSDIRANFYRGNMKTPFITPNAINGKNEIRVATHIITTLKVTDDTISKKRNDFINTMKKKKIDDIKVFAQYELKEVKQNSTKIEKAMFPVIDYNRDFPIDYNNAVLAPVTAIFYKEYFDYVGDMKKDVIRINYEYSDGKARYVRIPVKKNNDAVWDEICQKKQ